MLAATLNGMTKAQPLPEPLQGRSFLVSESDECGIKRRRTDASDLYTPSRGIRVPWDVEQDLDSRIRPLLSATPGGVASHSTAALLWEIPLPPWLAGRFDIHLSRNAANNPPARNGVTGHHTHFNQGDVVELRGLRVTSPLRTWLDLAAVLELDDLVAAGDFLVCAHDRIFGPKRVPLVPLPELRHAVLHEFRRRGIVKAREAVELIKVGVDSPPETRIRLSLQRAGIPELVLNFVVQDAHGRHVSWPDLALPVWKISIEYDGEHHRTPRQKDIDDARDLLMKQLGWLQLRITKAMLYKAGDRAVVRLVREALYTQGWGGRAA